MFVTVAFVPTWETEMPVPAYTFVEEEPPAGGAAAIQFVPLDVKSQPFVADVEALIGTKPRSGWSPAVEVTPRFEMI